MKTFRSLLFACALVAAAPLPQTQPNPNLSGTWQIEYHDRNGQEVSTPFVSFVQTGGHLDGVFGEKHWRVEGSVSGDRVQFSFHPAGHPDVTVKYQGRMESSTRIRGDM